MRRSRGGFYSSFFLALLLGVGIMVGTLYDFDARGSRIMQYYYQQISYLDLGVSKIAKACLNKYSLQECKELHFSLGRYEISLVLSPQDSKSLLLDSVVQTQNLLNGQILRRVSRRILLFSEHKIRFQ